MALSLTSFIHALEINKIGCFIQVRLRMTKFMVTRIVNNYTWYIVFWPRSDIDVRSYGSMDNKYGQNYEVGLCNIDLKG